MKRCPVCRRDYTDETLNYCLDDGATLLDGPGSGSEAGTAILSGDSNSFDSEKTRLLPNSDPRSTTTRSKARTIALVGALCLLVVVVSSWALFKYLKLENGPGTNFQNSTLTRVTTSGRAVEADISPDGKFVVYLEMGDDGNRGLWVKQIATGNAIPIVPPTKGNVLKNTTFSRDGNFVYYLFSDRTKRMSAYQVSSVGGTPRKVIDACDSPVAFSPDGQRFAFVRYEGSSQSQVVTSKTDGTDEKVIATLGGEEWFVGEGLSWSPDGKTIALPAGVLRDGTDEIRLVGIDTQDGSLRDLSPKRWLAAGRVVWMPDGASVLIVAIERMDESGMQVWQVGYSSGVAARITNDIQPRDTSTLGVTSDGRTVVTVSQQRLSRIESIPSDGKIDRLTRLSTSEANVDGFFGISALADGRIVFSSEEGGQSDLWIMNSDGSGRSKLTSDTFRDDNPTVSPDDRYILFKSNRPTGDAVPRLWRMNIDGTGMMQIAERADSAASFSPDGQSAIFTAWGKDQDMLLLWKVSIAGGQPAPITDFPTGSASFSPDGKWIGSYFSDRVPFGWRYGIMPATGGRPVRDFEFPGYQYAWVRWTADGKSVSYIGPPPDPSNIWLQGAEGGEPRKLTDFKSDYIFRHEWSRDGKMLFVVRGRPSTNVVLQTAGE